MAKETSYLHIKISPKLKQDFKAMCADNETDMSDKVREIVANMVRNHKRELAKTPKDQ